MQRREVLRGCKDDCQTLIVVKVFKLMKQTDVPGMDQDDDRCWKVSYRTSSGSLRLDGIRWQFTVCPVEMGAARSWE